MDDAPPAEEPLPSKTEGRFEPGFEVDMAYDESSEMIERSREWPMIWTLGLVGPGDGCEVTVAER